MSNPFTRARLMGLALAVVVYGADQWVKWAMIYRLSLRAVRHIDVLPFFDFTWAENYGVSLGMLTASSMEMRWILVAVTGLIALTVLVWLMREKARWDIAALGLILGGAMGNIHDRFSVGYVVDYADFHIGTFRPFLIFNLADVAITIGVVIILARALFLREKQDNPPESQPADMAAETP